MTIQEFLIQAINKGSDDTGKVHMQVEYNGGYLLWVLREYRYYRRFRGGFRGRHQ